MKQTILFISTPFSGHLNTVLALAKSFDALPDYRAILCIVGWRNVPLPIAKKDFKMPYYYFYNSELKDSEPDKFNSERAHALYKVLLKFVSRPDRFGKHRVDAIVYDFFAVEGRLLGDTLRVPSYCSIPAVPGATPESWVVDSVGAFDDKLRIVQEPLFEKYPPQMWKTVSDARFLPGSHGQLLWAPAALLQDLVTLPTDVAPFTWIRRQLPSVPSFFGRFRGGSATVVLSLGTVVVGNLRRLYPDSVDRWIDSIIQTMLKTLSCCRNWRLIVGVERENKSSDPRIRYQYPLDLKSELEDASLLITHGGGNTLTEAVGYNVPMLVIPFFGDQVRTAQHVVTQNAGDACYLFETDADPERGTPSTARFTTVPTDDKLAQFQTRLDSTLHKALKRLVERKVHIANLNYLRRPGCVDQCDWRPANNVVYFQNGDILLGTNVARKQFEQHYPNLNLRVGDTRPWSEIVGVEQTQTCLPRLVDQYNDVLRHPQTLQSELERCPKDSDYHKNLQLLDRLLTDFALRRPTSLESEEDRQDLWDMCTHNLRVLMDYNPEIHVHVLLDEYDSSLNRATRLEIELLEKLIDQYQPGYKFRLRSRMSFYKRDPQTLAVYRVGIPRTTVPSDEAVSKYIADSSVWFAGMYVPDALKSAPFWPVFQTNLASWRHKPSASVQQRCKDYQCWMDELVDLNGGRLRHSFTEALYAVANWLQQRTKSVTYTYVWEKGSVLYLFGQNLELQLWPEIMAANFCLDHDTIYKPKQKPSKEEKAAAAARRAEQHKLQEVLDNSEVAKYFKQTLTK